MRYLPRYIITVNDRGGVVSTPYCSRSSSDGQDRHQSRVAARSWKRRFGPGTDSRTRSRPRPGPGRSSRRRSWKHMTCARGAAPRTFSPRVDLDHRLLVAGPGLEQGGSHDLCHLGGCVRFGGVECGASGRCVRERPPKLLRLSRIVRRCRLAAHACGLSATLQLPEGKKPHRGRAARIQIDAPNTPANAP